MSASTNQSSAEIRQNKRHLRRLLSTKEQSTHAKALSRQLSRFNPFRYGDRVAFYLTNDGEIDPSLIINQAWNMGKRVHLPVLSPLKDQLYFSPYRTDTVMRSNRFGIEEPACHPRQWLGAQQLDVLFLPLVAFDKQGNRIGMGGGFYDRSLAYLSTRRSFKKPRLIGLAHDFQECANISHEKWDIPLEAIVTEKRIIHAR